MKVKFICLDFQGLHVLTMLKIEITVNGHVLPTDFYH